MSRNEFPKLPERLKECRIKSGMTQKQLSKKAEVSPSQLSKYESGKEIPRKASAIRLAKALSVSYEYLYGLVDEAQSFHPDNTEKEIMRLISQTKPLLPLQTTNKAEEIKGHVINQLDADFAVEMGDDTMAPVIMKGAICYGNKVLVLKHLHNKNPIGFFPPRTKEEKPLIRRFYQTKNEEKTMYVLEPINDHYQHRIVWNIETFVRRFQLGGLITHVLNKLPFDS